MGNNLVVLIVGDHLDVLVCLCSFFETLPYVTTMGSGSSGRATLCIEAEERIDLVVVNARLKGDFHGLRVAALAKAAHPNVAILLMSADERETFLNLPPDHSLIQVPFGVEAVLKHVDGAFVRRHESLDRV